MKQLNYVRKAAAMSEFKFNCPTCGQHILANENWVSRKINCPSCNSRIAVPPPAKEPKKAKPGVPPGSIGRGSRSGPPGGPVQTERALKEAGAVSAPVPAPAALKKAGEEVKAPKAKGERTAAPLLPPGAPVQGARPKLPSDSSPADIAAKKEGRAVTSQISGSQLPGNQGKVAKQALSKEAGGNGLVAPPGRGKPGKPRGGPLAGDAGAKEGVAISIPGPAMAANEKKEGVAKASSAKGPKEEAPGAAPEEPGGRIRVELPVAVPDDRSAPVVPADSAREEGQGGGGAESAPGAEAEATETAGEQLRVAVLSPAVKLELVRAARRRIADETGWLPGRVKGATAYAGKMEGGEVVLVDAKSPEATRFSMVGAFLREMDDRRVVRTATGRRRFLDEDIPEGIREVLLERVSDEEREGAEERLSAEDLESISHGQCLAVLDALEGRYMRREEQVQIEKAKRRLGGVRLADLVRKLEKKAPISPEEVATALYHELMEVRRRLDRLENRRSPGQ